MIYEPINNISLKNNCMYICRYKTSEEEGNLTDLTNPLNPDGFLGNIHNFYP